MSARRILFGILLLATSGPLGAGEKVAMKVSPAVSFAPATLFVRATVQADADNRAIEIVAESADFYGRSVRELHGQDAPRISEFQLRSLPGGRYDVTARLFGPSGEVLALSRERVNVLARDGSR